MLTISYTYVTQKDEKNESVISIDIIEMNNICIYCGRVLDIASILSFLGGIYTIVMDVGILVLPTWPLLWASRSFRIKLIQSILPEKLHEKIIGPITQSSKMVQNGQTTIKVLPANTIKMT
uniref:YrhK domain-containing protein n=1 Tax=Meloidogyne hapla TaxID=6305 RepID=A0A1I8C0P6_MELHA